MKPNPGQARLARLQRACEVYATPAIVLFVACCLLVLVLSLSAVPDEPAPPQARQSAQQPAPPAT